MRNQLSRSALAAAVLALTGASPAKTSDLLGVEHVPFDVNDLGAAELRFRTLGFTIKPGRSHGDGIRNALVKFSDGSYLELITAPATVDELTGEYRRHLAQGDGPAYLSLYVASLSGLQARLAEFGARDEEGSVTFPSGPLHAYFFGTRERSPTDRPEHFVHRNGAQGLERVWLAPSNPRAVEQMLARLGAKTVWQTACLARCWPARIAHLKYGEIALLPPAAQLVRGRDVVGASITVSSLQQVRHVLDRRPMGTTLVATGQKRVLVPPSMAEGMWLEFRQSASSDFHKDAI